MLLSSVEVGKDSCKLLTIKEDILLSEKIASS